VALAALAVALAAPSTVSALVLAACAGAAVLAGARRQRAPWRALLAAFGLGVMAALLRALLTPGAPLLAVHLGGHALQLSRAGAAQGGLALSRVLAATLSGSWLTSTTPFPQLVAALAWARVPAPLLELLLLAHRHRHALGDSLETVRCAQTMRLGYVGMRRSIASAGVLVGAAACRAIDQAGATADAMQLRGAHGLPALSPALAPALSLKESCPFANVLVAGCGAIAVIASVALGWGAPW
jgi:cobalt/nickel transport system permease protein